VPRTLSNIVSPSILPNYLGMLITSGKLSAADGGSNESNHMGGSGSLRGLDYKGSGKTTGIPMEAASEVFPYKPLAPSSFARTSPAETSTMTALDRSMPIAIAPASSLVEPADFDHDTMELLKRLGQGMGPNPGTSTSVPDALSGRSGTTEDKKP